MAPSPRVRISWTVPVVSCHDDSDIGRHQTDNRNRPDTRAGIQHSVRSPDDELYQTLEIPSTSIANTFSEVTDDSYSSIKGGASRTTHLQGGNRDHGDSDEKWRKHGQIFRAKLLQTDQFADSKDMVINHDCNLCRYFEVVKKIWEALSVTSLDNELAVVEAYLVGNRLVKLLSSILPTHREYFSKETVECRNRSGELLMVLLKFMDDLAWVIDEEQHAKFVKKSHTTGEETVSNVQIASTTLPTEISSNPLVPSDSTSHGVSRNPSRSDLIDRPENALSNLAEHHSSMDTLHDDESTLGWDVRFTAYEDQESSSGLIAISSSMEQSELLEVETPTFELSSTTEHESKKNINSSWIDSGENELEQWLETEFPLKFDSVDPFSQEITKENIFDYTSLPLSDSHEVPTTLESLPQDRTQLKEIKQESRSTTMPAKQKSGKIRKSLKILKDETSTSLGDQFVYISSPTSVRTLQEADDREPIIRRSYRFSDDECSLDEDFQILSLRNVICKGRLNSFKGCIKTWFAESHHEQ